MGLAIVRGIAEAHGGRAWLEPAPPGSGATFSITLPVAPDGAG
jgi:signal transduction histidine kinase